MHDAATASCGCLIDTHGEGYGGGRVRIRIDMRGNISVAVEVRFKGRIMNTENIS